MGQRWRCSSSQTYMLARNTIFQHESLAGAPLPSFPKQQQWLLTCLNWNMKQFDPRRKHHLHELSSSATDLGKIFVGEEWEKESSVGKRRWRQQQQEEYKERRNFISGPAQNAKLGLANAASRKTKIVEVTTGSLEDLADRRNTAVRRQEREREREGGHRARPPSHGVLAWLYFALSFVVSSSSSSSSSSSRSWKVSDVRWTDINPVAAAALPIPHLRL